MGYVLPKGSSKLRPGDVGYKQLQPLPKPVKIPMPTYRNGCPILEKEK